LVEEASRVKEKPGPKNIKAHEDSSFDVFDNACYIRPQYVPLFALEKENIGSADGEMAGEVRRTLQLAAVIGRSFYRRVLEHVTQTDLEFSTGGDQVTDAHLSILQQQERPPEARRIWQEARVESEAMGERKMRW